MADSKSGARPRNVLRNAAKVASKIADDLNDPRVKMKDLKRAKKSKNARSARLVPLRRGRKCLYPLENFITAMLYRWYYDLSYRDVVKQLKKLRFECPDYTYLDKIKDIVPNRLFVRGCQQLKSKLGE